MSQVSAKSTVGEVVVALFNDTGTLEFTPQESKVFIQVLRRLTEGQPISTEQVTEIAAKFDLSGEDANAALNWVAERNDDGRIVGMGGLSQNHWTHKFKVNGRNMATWCALDTLYLPQLLKQTAEVKSPDPLSGELVHLTIGPENVINYAPADAVLSIVIPKIKEKGVQSAEEIYMAFCSYSHYFTSIESGQKWFTDTHIEPVFLSVEEGHELGRKWFAQVMKYA